MLLSADLHLYTCLKVLVGPALKVSEGEKAATPFHVIISQLLE